jgi:hypothetical protein
VASAVSDTCLCAERRFSSSGVVPAMRPEGRLVAERHRPTDAPALGLRGSPDPGTPTQTCGCSSSGGAATFGAVLSTTIARRLGPLVVAASCLTMTIGSSGAQTLTIVNDPVGRGAGLAPPQVALIGRRMLQTLAPTGRPTVTVFATTWGRAEALLVGPSRPRSETDPTAAELVTVRGRRRRRGRPVGRELWGVTIWIPNGARTESGVLQRVSKQLAELGRGTTYNLALHSRRRPW